MYNSSAQLHRILIHLILVSQLVLLAMTERPAFQFIFSFCASNTQERRLSAIIYSSRFLQLFNLKLFRSVFVLRSFNSILIITSCRTTPCQLHLLQLYVRSLCHNCSRGPRTWYRSAAPRARIQSIVPSSGSIVAPVINPRSADNCSMVKRRKKCISHLQRLLVVHWNFPSIVPPLQLWHMTRPGLEFVMYLSELLVATDFMPLCLEF